MSSIIEKNININSPFESYWGVFLEFGCTLHCSYCIQKINSHNPRYDRVEGIEWVNALNSIESRTKKRFLRPDKIKKLALIGGEPSLHPDFIYILNNLDNHYSITVTTNLYSPLFKDMGLFVKSLKRRKGLRFHISYHPSTGMDICDFISKIKLLKRSGIKVHKMFIVAYPPDDNEKMVSEYKKIFKRNKLFLETQRYLGFYKDKLYPNRQFEGSNYEFQDNINNYELYRKACSQNNNKKILCKILKVLFAPNGTVYNCHYKLYSKSEDNYGNIFRDKIINLPQDLFLCDSFGFCNPCDFGHASFKEIINEQK